MIEIGPHPELPEALMFHSTVSGKFMRTDRAEVVQLVEAAKRGLFDGLFTDPPEPVPTDEIVDGLSADHPLTVQTAELLSGSVSHTREVLDRAGVPLRPPGPIPIPSNPELIAEARRRYLGLFPDAPEPVPMDEIVDSVFLHDLPMLDVRSLELIAGLREFLAEWLAIIAGPAGVQDAAWEQADATKRAQCRVEARVLLAQITKFFQHKYGQEPFTPTRQMAAEASATVKHWTYRLPSGYRSPLRWTTPYAAAQHAAASHTDGEQAEVYPAPRPVGELVGGGYPSTEQIAADTVAAVLHALTVANPRFDQILWDDHRHVLSLRCSGAEDYVNLWLHRGPNLTHESERNGQPSTGAVVLWHDGQWIDTPSGPRFRLTVPPDRMRDAAPAAGQPPQAVS